MKKLAIVLALALVVSLTASIGASAFYTGESASEQLEYIVPKINPNNPAIVIDGKVDLEGEWYGAVKTGVDLSSAEAAENYGLWDATVWGQTFSYGEVNDDYYTIPDEFHNVWDVYWLWDEAGLYFALVCDTDTTPSVFNPAIYTDGGIEGQTHRVDGFTPMIRPSDSEEDAYEWLEFWAATIDGTPFWNDDSMIYHAKNAETPFTIETASWRSTTPNENGAYPYSIEAFLSWDSICYGTGAEKVIDITPAAGLTIMIGQIFLDGNGLVDENNAPYDWARGFDCPGWGSFNYYMMSATPAADAPTAEAPAEEPAVEEPAEEPTVEEPETEEPEVTPSVETSTPAPVVSTSSNANPSTADVSVIFYALAALSAVGGISVFRKK